MRGLRRWVLIVQRYVKSPREHPYQEGKLELDFGEADFYDASGEK